LAALRDYQSQFAAQASVTAPGRGGQVIVQGLSLLPAIPGF